VHTQCVLRTLSFVLCRRTKPELSLGRPGFPELERTKYKVPGTKNQKWKIPR